jgi:hypothetical protein
MGRLDPAARRIPGCTTEGYDRDRACETDDTFKLFRNTSFNEIPTSKAMYLNPRLFNQGRPITSANGKAQCSQGDLDVIVGDVLIDLKTTQNRRVNARDVCQILGYYMTTVIHRQSNIRSWPDIKYLCLYYPRFNEIVKIETSVVQKNSHWLSALYAFGGNASGVKSRLASTVNGSN